MEATQRFNAAAVALEMSWLKLFADTGCLTESQQELAQAAVHDYTVALQTSLSEGGYYQAAVDGVYGPATVEAVEALQKAHGLPVTGTVDKATAAALQADLQAKGGAAAQQALVSTAAVQQTLKLAGFWDGRSTAPGHRPSPTPSRRSRRSWASSRPELSMPPRSLRSTSRSRPRARR